MHYKLLIIVFLFWACGKEDILLSTQGHNHVQEVNANGYLITQDGVVDYTTPLKVYLIAIFVWNFSESEAGATSGNYKLIFENFRWVTPPPNPETDGILIHVSFLRFFDPFGREIGRSPIEQDISLYENQIPPLSNTFTTSIPVSVANEVASVELHFSFPQQP